MLDFLLTVFPFIALAAAIWLIPVGLVIVSLKKCWIYRRDVRANKHLWLPPAIGLGVSLAIVLLGGGSWGRSMLLMFFLFIVGIPSLLVWSVMRISNRGLAAQPTVLAIAMTVAWMFMSIPMGRGVAYYSAMRTQKDLEKVISQLDAFKATHGIYPSSLEALSPPAILSEEFDSYRGDSDSFEIDFLDSDGWYSTYTYSSKDRRWVYYAD